MIRIFTSLSVTYFQSKHFLLREQLVTIQNYYRRPRFALADFLICLSSLFLNPYRACRRFFEREGKEGVYGETPLSVFQQIAKASLLEQSDRYVELGSGRGKTCLWASEFCGCKSVGIERVPAFLFLSRMVSWVCNIPADFKNESIFEVDLSAANVVYLSAIHFSEEEMEVLKTLFSKMPKGARLITMSEPFAVSQFKIDAVLDAAFPWGKTEVFVHIRQ